MSKQSIVRILSFLLGLPIISIVAASVVALVWAVGELRTANTIVELTEVDRDLFAATQTTRVQSGGIQTALQTMDDPKGKIAEIRGNSDKVLTAAITGLAATSLDETPALLAELTKMRERVKEFEATLYTEAEKPKDSRDLRATKSWVDANQALATTVASVGTRISTQIRLADPLLAELAQVREAAWGIRGAYGSNCSLLRPNVSDARPLTSDEVKKLGSLRGGVDMATERLQILLARPEVSSRVTQAFHKAEGEVAEATKWIDNVVTKFDGSGTAVVPAAEWTSRCNAPFATIIDLGNAALDEAVLVAQGKRSQALWDAALAAAGMIVALALATWGWSVLRRRIARPVEGLHGAVARLAGHDYVTAVDLPPYDDEFRGLAQALEALRDSAARAERLAAEDEERRRLDAVRAAAIADLCKTFDGAIQGALGSLGKSAGDLRETAGSMRELSAQSRDRADEVATAADGATRNVQTVATATEELNASIGEIARRVGASAEEARSASQMATHTNATVEAMTESAHNIGEALALIRQIADQTNLLALNATIEAARAGDAGKGFAVVAGEVKNLAHQTAKATEDIEKLVQEIQATTEEAVTAVHSIGNAISGIDGSSSAIAAAIEEQSAATQEISRNVTLAAEGTVQVTRTIETVAQASRQTGQAADKVFSAVEEVVGVSEILRRQVEEFLDGVRRA